jgi:hypothetical protein
MVHNISNPTTEITEKNCKSLSLRVLCASVVQEGFSRSVDFDAIALPTDSWLAMGGGRL